MMVLVSSSYGYQSIDCRRHSVTRYMNGEKNTSGDQQKMFRRLGLINYQLYAVELAKSENEHKEPIIVSSLILQYSKLGMLELYYNFFTNLYDTDKYEEMEKNTDLLQNCTRRKKCEFVQDVKKSGVGKVTWQRL